ncbi:MAG: hypothetical protein JRH11_23795 [Deltaproteobacteria bacterium]|nr:hypothetical protein [Deltaproteobacteria bacterium]
MRERAAGRVSGASVPQKFVSRKIPAEPIEPAAARAPPTWPDDLFDVA